MQFDPDEVAMLAGEQGLAKQRAMRFLVDYAGIVGATRFVKIRCAHIDGILYHGQSSLDFVESFTRLKAQVCVPTTLNVGAVDSQRPAINIGDASLISEQAKLTAAYELLGCQATLTCAPYQRRQRPALGEQIAWAESNAIVFANSVLGARTERYGDFTDLCAALTGRVPLIGLHVAHNRLAKRVIDVVPLAKSGLSRDLYFACVGFCLGQLVGSNVAVLRALPGDTNEDELKAVGAAAASSGAVAMFHAVGITPEARTLVDALGGPENLGLAEPGQALSIQAHDLVAAFKRLSPVQTGEPLAAICLGTPHYSLSEFARLAKKVQGRSSLVEVYVSTSRDIAQQIRLQPDYADLVNFGVQLVVDTCTYLAPVVRQSSGVILTTSAKWAHYGPGNIRRRAGLKSLDDCIRSAESGVVCG